MRVLSASLLLLLLPVIFSMHLATPTQTTAAPSESPSVVAWRAREGALASWSLGGCAELSSEGTIQLASCAPPGELAFGEATSPELHGLTFQQAIASWNVQTPAETWIDVLVRVRVGEQWSAPPNGSWYHMGVWTAATGSSVRRESVPGQSDSMASVQVDTLVLHDHIVAANAVQVKLRLYSRAEGLSPSVERVSVALSGHPASIPTSAGNPALWNRSLDVPACSQMVYPDGGEIWCSPTSVSMVLGYWQGGGDDAASCEARVRHAVSGVYDYVYEGHGNWPFNVAYAATQGLEGYVTRMRGLDEAEEWIARGIPVVISFGWQQGQLDGAPLPTSGGHLAVLTGFTAEGRPIVHDPAANPNSEPSQSVVRSYRRDQLEHLWLSRTAGTAYIIAPPQAFDPPRLYIPMLQR